MKQQKGFTLIELIVVIVILGILAATALPRFVDFGTQASDAAVAGVAGAMASASSINVGNRSLTPAAGIAVLDTAANICTTAAGTAGEAIWVTPATSILQGGMPAGFTLAVSPVDPNGVVACAAGGVVVCRVTETQEGQTADATIACIP